MANVNDVKSKLASTTTNKEGGKEINVDTNAPTKMQLYKRFQQIVSENMDAIKQALPKHFNAERLARIALTESRKNPALLDCSATSFITAILTSAQLGLEPSVMGQVYFIPYYNSKTQMKEVQFQIGYRGLLELVRRSGEIQSISAHEVYEKDQFEFEYGLNEKLIHKPYLNGDRGKMVAVYAVARFKDGGQAFEVMTIEDVNKLRDRSRSANSGPWVTDYPAMAKKTVLKQLCKYLPLQTEVSTALAVDETVKENIAPIEESNLIYPSTDETTQQDTTDDIPQEFNQ
jgi:recombination protein RecT